MTILTDKQIDDFRLIGHGNDGSIAISFNIVDGLLASHRAQSKLIAEQAERIKELEIGLPPRMSDEAVRAEMDAWQVKANQHACTIFTPEGRVKGVIEFQPESQLSYSAKIKLEHG